MQNKGIGKTGESNPALSVVHSCRHDVSLSCDSHLRRFFPFLRTLPGARLVHNTCTGDRSMPSRKRASRKRFRVGRVSLYLHHGAWWLYYRDGGQPIRRRVAHTAKEAEQVAAQVNAQLTQSAPTLLAFAPIGLPELRQEFFNYHEYVLRSSL